MLAPGRILRAGLVVATEHPYLAPEAHVSILANDKPTEYGVKKPNKSYSVSTQFLKPLEVAKTHVIGLKTETSSPEVKGVVVNLLIELDL